MIKNEHKNIGIIGIKAPSAKCADPNCPYHGKIKLRGKIFSGKVIRASMQKTVTVEWPISFYIRKYERYEKRRSRIKAHNPECINAKVGDNVTIMECRPISKTKNFVVIEKAEK